MKDYQRQKVYNWERLVAKHYNKEMWGADWTTKECEKYASMIWNRYKNIFTNNFNPNYDYCSKVKVKLVGGSTCTMQSGFYSMGKKKTKTRQNRWYKKMHLTIMGCNKKIIIHEIAHALSPRNSQHDKYFVGIYMYLMAKYLNYDLKIMVKLANDNKIDFTWNKKNQFTGFASPLSKLIKPYLRNKDQTKSTALPVIGLYRTLPSSL
tara:strand:- start:295 stop:915 length:621 start_codon:yes stop_codon:yes gene_type:complete